MDFFLTLFEKWSPRPTPIASQMHQLALERVTISKIQYNISKYITTIMNLSLVIGLFPSEFKKSIIRPLIKKETLDPDELSNCRPISNLSFLSKTLERIVASQIDEYLHDNGLYAGMQSAYRKYHSTETALIRVVNDIQRAIDDQCESVLVLLDLSAAFDTIDHEILLERLRFRYGFSNLVLQWFTFYLIDRPQRIVLDKFSSQPRRLSCGVTQGSVLGPVLFTLYVAPLEDVIMAHGLNAMMCADAKLEKLGAFYPALLRNILFMHLFLQNLITATAFFSVSPPTSWRNYNGCKIQPQG